MVADFGAAVEEVERTRMMSQIGLEEIRRRYELERQEFDAKGGDQQREYEVQVAWQRAELARAEIENDYPSLNAQALIGLYSALDALVQELAPALRDLPFQIRLDEAEKQAPEVAQHLTPELRSQLIEEMQKVLRVPSLRRLEKKGTSRYERRLRRVGLGARRQLPSDLDQALRELGVLRDLIVHRAARIDPEASTKAPSLKQRYADGDLIRLTGDDYRTYSAAIRWYAGEITRRLLGSGPGEDDESDDDWRQHHLSGA